MVQEANEILMLLGLIGERVGRIASNPNYGAEGGVPPMGPPLPADLMAQAPAPEMAMAPPGMPMGPPGMPMGSAGQELPMEGPDYPVAGMEPPVGGPGPGAMAGGVPPMAGPMGPEEQAILQMLGQKRAV